MPPRRSIVLGEQDIAAAVRKSDPLSKTPYDDLVMFTIIAEDTGKRCFECDVDCKEVSDQENVDTCEAACNAMHARIRESVRAAGYDCSEESVACGAEGRVLVDCKRPIVVKVLVLRTPEHHSARVAVWRRAGETGVGPTVHRAWHEVLRDDATLSFVAVAKMDDFSNATPDALDALFEKTANAGLLHCDGTEDNLMSDPETGEPRLVDWDAAIVHERADPRLLHFAMVARYWAPAANRPSYWDDLRTRFLETRPDDDAWFALFHTTENALRAKGVEDAVTFGAHLRNNVLQLLEGTSMLQSLRSKSRLWAKTYKEWTEEQRT